MTRLTANGIQLEYEAHGNTSGEVLVLVRGLGTQLIDWPESLIEGLVDQDYRVICFDNRDVGLSRKFDASGKPDIKAINEGDLGSLAYSLQDMAEDIIGLMDTLVIESAHLFGISMGGMIVQLAAATHGDRVKSLFSVMSSSGRPGLPQASPEAQKALMETVEPDASTQDIIRRVAEDFVTFGSPGYLESETLRFEMATRRVKRQYYPEGVTRQMAAVVASASRVDLLKTISVPTLIIHGEDDPLIPVAAGVDTADCIPGARLEIIPGMGHNIPDALVPRFIELIVAHTSIK